MTDDVTEELAREMWLADNWGRENSEREWDELRMPPPIFERYRRVAQALLPTVRRLQGEALEESARIISNIERAWVDGARGTLVTKLDADWLRARAATYRKQGSE